MKKWLLVLGMITCMFGLTACGQKETETPLMTEAEAEAWGSQLVETMNQYVVQQAQAQATDPILISAIESWETAAEDMGTYEEVISVESSFDGEDGIIEVEVKGSLRDAVVEIVIEKSAVTSVTTNVNYSFGETMEKAALNTLLGMGTVFCVLILISLIISCFGIIPKIQDKFAKKPAKNDVKNAAVDNTIAQIIEKEELSDDLELVAVISAAIAASEGASSTDGFVVRSIRRAGSKWQRA